MNDEKKCLNCGFEARDHSDPGKYCPCGKGGRGWHDTKFTLERYVPPAPDSGPWNWKEPKVEDSCGFKYQKQSVIGDGGDCLRTSMAKYFKIPLDSIPYWNPNSETYWKNIRQWLWNNQKCLAHQISISQYKPSITPYTPWIAGGPGPRGFGHAVLMLGENMVFDPHPSNAGLLYVDTAYNFLFCDEEYDWAFSSGASSKQAEVEGLVKAAQEVWSSVPGSYGPDDPMVMRHSRALNELHAALSNLGKG